MPLFTAISLIAHTRRDCETNKHIWAAYRVAHIAFSPQKPTSCLSDLHTSEAFIAQNLSPPQLNSSLPLSHPSSLSLQRVRTSALSSSCASDDNSRSRTIPTTHHRPPHMATDERKDPVDGDTISVVVEFS
jgi:hypothetical protein